MTKLTDLQLAGLIDEIACAIQVGDPIDQTLRRLQNRRMGKVGRVAGAIALRLDRGESLEEAISEIASPVTIQLQAAIAAASARGDGRLIARLADQLRRRDQYLGASRIAYFYPLLLASIAYASMVWVAAPLVLQNRGRDFHWAPWLTTSLQWLSTNYWIPPLIVLAIALVLWFLFLRGQSALPYHSRRSLFFFSLADQIRGNVPESDAISLAARLAGERQLASIDQPTLDTPAVARLIGQSNTLADIERQVEFIQHASSPKPDGESSPTTREPSILVARLYYLGAHHAEAAQRAIYCWSRLVPRAVMILIGCGFVLSYAWWVIAPIYKQVAQW
ncbi:Bacterial type II secretion system protein F domain protein [Rubripirellula lacrimiformis]|uniref:Bacterial type II secretion system protein F domain protein n=1 Tax=Rubripirellula lacrimiformis TaxID=1930273 RepID=A0A517NA94_9BACT|nr:type II secretion system F family protein [Rubripirellula lacrimiformis]QDT04052.1 Bacterial type II secretion system protein F domain protein [Rubripirellula lacrimiformis]